MKKHQSNEIFFEKLKATLEQLAFDVDFEINDLCLALGISRSSLHRKCRASTNQSTSIFIRTFRLQKAKQLVETTQLPIREIALKVGFSDLAYFSKCFKLMYGMAPSKLRNTLPPLS